MFVGSCQGHVDLGVIAPMLYVDYPFLSVKPREIAEQLDRIVRPLGFRGHKAIWNRTTSSFVEAIDLQVDKSHTAVTINAGVLDPQIHGMVWRTDLPKLVEAPACTVAVRIGELIDGRDRWWDLIAEPGGDIVSAVTSHVVPFFGRMKTREALADWLAATRVERRGYPPPIMALAILKVLSGDRSAGCALLRKLEPRAQGSDWGPRVAQLAAQLDCDC